MLVQQTKLEVALHNIDQLHLLIVGMIDKSHFEQKSLAEVECWANHL